MGRSLRVRLLVAAVLLITLLPLAQAMNTGATAQSDTTTTVPATELATTVSTAPATTNATNAPIATSTSPSAPPESTSTIMATVPATESMPPTAKVGPTPYPITGSDQSANSPLAQIVYDQDANTIWLTQAPAPPNSAFVVLDLGDLLSIGNIRWLVGSSGLMGSLQLQLSEDGLSWVTLAAPVAGEPDTWQEQWAGVNARFVRFLFTNPNQEPQIGGLAEVEIWPTDQAQTLASLVTPTSLPAQTEPPMATASTNPPSTSAPTVAPTAISASPSPPLASIATPLPRATTSGISQRAVINTAVGAATPYTNGTPATPTGGQRVLGAATSSIPDPLPPPGAITRLPVGPNPVTLSCLPYSYLAGVCPATGGYYFITTPPGCLNHGQTTSNYDRRAIDIMMPEKTPVLAATDGVVAFAGWDPSGGGNSVVVSYDDSTPGNVKDDTLHTLYLHLSSITVHQGEKVTAGTLLGLSGSTGNSTGPHLHFAALVPPFAPSTAQYPLMGGVAADIRDAPGIAWRNDMHWDNGFESPCLNGYDGIVVGQPENAPPPKPGPASCSLGASGGPVGASITVSCANFNKAETVNIYWQARTTPLASFTTSEARSGSASITVPETWGGSWLIRAVGAKSGKSVSMTFTVVPSLALSPQDGASGTQVNAALHGFQPNETVELDWWEADGSTFRSLRTGIVVSALGSGATTFNAPASTPGGHEVDGVGSTADRASASFTLLSPPPPTSYSFLAAWGSQGSGTTQFDNPAGIAVDGGGNVYVADSGNDRILKFTSDGDYVGQWGSYGSGNGQFLSPVGIALDSAGDIYVTDMGNRRVEKFSTNGTYLTQWGSWGTGDGQFSSPQGIAVDSAGNVYVVDSVRVEKFSGTGTYLGQWGSSGSAEGQFSNAVGIAVDAGGTVYVADSGNNRVQLFSTNGTFVGQLGTGGSGDGQFYNPYGIALDAAGDIFVTDWGNARIVKFRSDGTFLTSWGGRGEGNGQFDGPFGIAVAGNGNVYVTDYYNYRVQEFAPSS